MLEKMLAYVKIMLTISGMKGIGRDNSTSFNESISCGKKRITTVNISKEEKTFFHVDFCKFFPPYQSHKKAFKQKIKTIGFISFIVRTRLSLR